MKETNGLSKKQLLKLIAETNIRIAETNARISETNRRMDRRDEEFKQIHLELKQMIHQVAGLQKDMIRVLDRHGDRLDRLELAR